MSLTKSTTMKVKIPFFVNLFVLQCLSNVASSSMDFDFFYFVQQWAPSYCQSRNGCCYPTTGKPEEDFSIHGLWPNYINGKWPHNCKSQSPLNESTIQDLMDRMQTHWPTLACPSSTGKDFWSHEWMKHGTCSSLDQHSYFRSALNLRDDANLLEVLSKAGIHLGNSYSLKSIKQAIIEGVGYEPFIDCNVNHQHSSQLFQVYLCVDKDASTFIDCPVLPHGNKCGSTIEFPSFSSAYASESKSEL